MAPPSPVVDSDGFQLPTRKIRIVSAVQAVGVCPSSEDVSREKAISSTDRRKKQYDLKSLDNICP